MPPHSLTNFEIQKNYQNEPEFNGVYSRHNLHEKIKTPLSKIPLLNVLFGMQFHWVYKNEWNCEHIFIGGW